MRDHATSDTGTARLATARLLLAAMRPRTIHAVRSAAINLGFAVGVAEDLAGFESRLDADDPGLVVIDLNVPDSFGVGAIRLLRTRASRAGLILISGLDETWLRSVQRMIVESGVRLQSVLRRPLDMVSVERELSRAQQQLMFSAGDLSRALDEGEIRVQYQPVIDLHMPGRWKIDSFEVLARWQHPTFGLILPACFIPLAESAGLIANLSRHVFKLALAEFAPLLQRHAALSLSFNLSPALLHSEGLAAGLEFLAKMHGIDPARITLEVSETGIGDAVAAAAALNALRDSGFRLCIDDFGIGESSLARFCSLPVGEFKIHRSLVRELGESDEARIIVELLFDLSKRLHLKVGAEGVEGRSIVEMLRAMGCDRAQGFYFGEPAPFEHFLPLFPGTSEPRHRSAAPAATSGGDRRVSGFVPIKGGAK